MDNETFRACQIAIRERIKWIDALRATNSPQSKRAGLVMAAYAIDALARRFIKVADWPGHTVSDDVRLGWEMAWYMDYIKATAEVCKAAQSAVRDKRLTLRSQLTRTPLDAGNLDSWMTMDMDAALVQDAAGFWPGMLQLKPFDRWPDVVCLPPGAVDIQDLADWAAAERLATADEVMNMLTGEAAPALETATPAPVATTATAGWLPGKRPAQPVASASPGRAAGTSRTSPRSNHSLRCTDGRASPGNLLRGARYCFAKRRQAVWRQAFA